MQDREDLARRALTGKYESLQDVATLRKRFGPLLAEAKLIGIEVDRLEAVLAEVRLRWAPAS